MDDVISGPYIDEPPSSVTAQTMENQSLRLRPSATVETAPLADGLMVVAVDTGGCWQLNRLGGEVWELFKNGSSVSAAIDILLERYPIGRDTLSRDLQSLVDDLLAHGLLTVASVG